MKSTEIQCPECGHTFTPSDSFERAIKQEVERELAKGREKLSDRESQLKQREAQLSLATKELADRVEAEVSKRTSKLEEEAKKTAETKVSVELKDLSARLSEKERALAESQQAELGLRKSMRAVEEKERQLNLEIERQVQQRVEAEKSSYSKQAHEEFQLKLMEKDKQIRDIQSQLESAKRAAHQGSQQTQGETVEEAFEQDLALRFPTDSFEAVPKGVEGADLIQHVRNVAGNAVGKMLWEFKNTKAYNSDWVTKLAKDQRELDADIAILVTRTLPKDSSPIEIIGGIFVVSYGIALPFASALRKSLEELSYARAVTEGQDEKMKLIYSYLTGPAFKQKILSIVDAFQSIKDQLESEKRAYKRIWAAREKMLDQVIDSASGMYGDIEGIAGRVLPKIDALALLEPAATHNELAETVEA